MCRRSIRGCIPGAILLAGCIGTEVDPYAAIPTTSATCLAHAHQRQDEGLPALPAAPASADKPPPIEAAPDLVEGHRISGQRLISPDLETRRAMYRAQVVKTAPAFKLCLDANGVPKTVELLRSSCFPRYDAILGAKMSAWRYSPYMKDGVGIEVCTGITFIYSQTVER